jgi:integral membrane protein GPR137
MFNVSSFNKDPFIIGTIRSATRVDDFPTLPFPTARPAYNQGVFLSLTITFIVIYALIFAAVYLQLVLILYFRHKRFSYQTGFLYLCLIWSLLRIVLFSFYFNNAKYANTLPYVFYFLLFCFPSFLQFCTLCLLVLFFGQVYIKVAKRYAMQKLKLVKIIMKKLKLL